MARRGSKANPYIVNTDGVKRYYRDWLAEVVAVAEAFGMPEEVKAQVHGAWLMAGWENAERPAYFVRKAWEMLTGDEHPEVFPDPVAAMA